MNALHKPLIHDDELIKPVDADTIRHSQYARRNVGCLVLTQDHKILLQQRDRDCERYPGCLATFGGGIEPGETAMQALVRELQEELGAIVIPEDVIPLGAITEKITNYNELLYVYFWHDKHGTITGCYEGTAMHYPDLRAAEQHPKVMDDVCWLLYECQYRKLL